VHIPKTLYRHSPGGSEETHGYPELVQLVCGPTFEPCTWLS